MRVVFRADASPTIGGGHVMRCLALAEELRLRGHDCVFITQQSTFEVFPRFAESPLEIVDAKQVSFLADRELEALGADLFLIDHYELPLAIETAARRFAATVVLDDAPGRPHDCDLLLDTTFGRHPSDYKKYISEDTFVLCGSAYALVRPVFGRLRESSIRRRTLERVDRISVCFGATNVHNYSEATALRLAHDFPNSAIDLIIGSSVVMTKAGKEALAAQPNISVHVDPPNFAELLSNSSLAIGSAGTMSWERCCLALPSIVVPLVDNQRQIAVALSTTGSAVSIDCAPENVVEEVAVAAAELDRDPLRREQMAACAAAICDGQGLSRIASYIEALADRGRNRSQREITKLRPAREADSAAIWAWRNDYQTRRISETSAPVTWSDHTRWFAGSLQAPNRLIYVAEFDKISEPVGMVRFDLANRLEAVVSINLAPHARGHGVGFDTLTRGCALAFETWAIDRIIARVRDDNTASTKLFQSIGFEPQAQTGRFIAFELARHDFCR